MHNRNLMVSICDSWRQAVTRAQAAGDRYLADPTPQNLAESARLSAIVDRSEREVQVSQTLRESRGRKEA